MKTLTTWQHHTLMQMYLFECVSSMWKDTHEHQRIFTRASISAMNGLDIQTYHVKKLDELIEWGWLEQAPHKEIYGRSYMLTDMARTSLAQNFAVIARNSYRPSWMKIPGWDSRTK